MLMIVKCKVCRREWAWRVPAQIAELNVRSRVIVGLCKQCNDTLVEVNEVDPKAEVVDAIIGWITKLCPASNVGEVTVVPLERT